MPDFFKASIVEEVFAITGRGCIVCGEFSRDAEVRIGTALELRRSGAVVHSSQVIGIDVARNLERYLLGLLVRDLDKASVEVGDEIWLGTDAQV